jgi:hypothetical protein
MVFWPYVFVILDLLKINYQLSVIDAPLGTYLSESPNLQIFISSHHEVLSYQVS